MFSIIINIDTKIAIFYCKYLLIPDKYRSSWDLIIDTDP